jgi:hypothetical protein
MDGINLLKEKKLAAAAAVWIISQKKNGQSWGH